MDEATKISRRTRWRNFNFAGSIDWAVDLQRFSDADRDTPPKRPDSGSGCISGEDNTVDSLDLCSYACHYGFCPTTLCTCTETGDLEPLPAQVFSGDIEAHDSLNVDLNRLCTFACTYGHCPSQVCQPPVIDEYEDEVIPSNPGIPNRHSNNINRCILWKGKTSFDVSPQQCKVSCKE